MAKAREPIVKLGPLSHVGLVVEDVDKAAEFFTSVFGIGPFSTEIYELNADTHFRYKGKPAEARMKAAIAFSDRVFIELVEVLEGESPHTEFLRQHGEGLQHIAFHVENIEQAVSDLAQEGLEPILQYKFRTQAGGKPIQVQEVYLNSAERIGGTTIQLMQITPLDHGGAT